ncbi:MAG: hypothetical protein MJ132_03385 [Clostridia bacterium]|nr:hypothetical protein [Clostridia bacterium]
MSFKIGFSGGTAEPEKEILQAAPEKKPLQAKKSVVKVYFAERDSAYGYYNDAFDLKAGDFVWVEGKLEGILGRVVEVNYNFKIKLSDYKRVIGVVDTGVGGTFCPLGSYLVKNSTKSDFDTVKTWFMPPESEEEELAFGYDDFSFPIDELQQINISDSEAEKGFEYFNEGKVVYLEVVDGKGAAIVTGHRPYVVEFCYKDGEISHLTCECYAVSACRHEFSVMIALKTLLKPAEENCAEIKLNENNFVAIHKVDFFRFLVEAKETGTVTVEQ